MADCNYSVPPKDISGDSLYGTRICDQAFIDWVWYSYNFDYDYWQDGWGYDDCCNIDKPLARTFNALWALNYSSDNPQDESYDQDNLLYWGGRYVREKMNGFKLRALCGSNNTTNATTFGAGCTEYRNTVKWGCTQYQRDGYESCSWDCCDWWPCSWGCELASWICKGWIWLTTFTCIAYGYLASWVCTAGLEIGNAFSQIKRIELYNINFFYGQDVVQRASILFHECRHIDGKAHNADFPSWASGLAGQSGADSSWDYQGAYCWQVAWLAWYWATAQNSSPALRAKARVSANAILGYAFAELPSFTI
ncbi:MAG: hypothetical protein ABI184_06740 [Ginsengibacter sp.]